MARTKQTARQSTGGAAKRKLLLPPAMTLRPRSSRSRGSSRSPSSHSQRLTPDVEMVDITPSDAPQVAPAADTGGHPHEQDVGDGVEGGDVVSGSQYKSYNISI